MILQSYVVKLGIDVEEQYDCSLTPVTLKKIKTEGIFQISLNLYTIL